MKVPEFEQRREVRSLIEEFSMSLISGLPFLGRAFSRVLDFESGGDDGHVMQAAFFVGRQ